jgi:hypothetical protein
MLASESHDEYVEGRGLLEKRHPAAQSHRQQLKLRLLAVYRYEQFFKSTLVEAIAWDDVKRHDPIQLLAVEEKAITDEVVDQIPVSPQSLKPDGQ